MPATRTQHIPSPMLAVLLAWLLPGLGHWYLGRRNKAIVFAAGIILLLITGSALGQWRVVSFNDKILFLGQGLAGLPSILLGVLSGRMLEAHGPPNLVSNAYEMGVLYTLVAGLLNLLVIFDAYMLGSDIESKALGKSHDQRQEAENA